MNSYKISWDRDVDNNACINADDLPIFSMTTTIFSVTNFRKVCDFNSHKYPNCYSNLAQDSFKRYPRTINSDQGFLSTLINMNTRN